MVNPTTCELIVEEECNDDAKSLIGYWLGGFLDEPHFNNETLKAAWEAFVENFYRDNSGTPFCWDALDKFLEEYDNPAWIGYEITSSGIACGPISFTEVFIVENDVVVEELDDDEIDDDDQQ
jgi:hypothetical protein